MHVKCQSTSVIYCGLFDISSRVVQTRVMRVGALEALGGVGGGGGRREKQLVF